MHLEKTYFNIMEMPIHAALAFQTGTAKNVSLSHSWRRSWKVIINSYTHNA